jgi:carbon-monoxide dehydrogenase medium subunit
MTSRLLPPFDLLVPQNISEAVDMLTQHQHQVSILNGGTALWNHNRKTKHQPPYVLSLSALKDLDYVTYLPGEGLRIGAKAKIQDLIETPVISARFPALYAAAFWFGNPQIRFMATVMGNLLRASPSADCSCAILALGGQVVLQSQAGQRIVDIDDFWISYDVTARRPDELATEIRIPEATSATRSSFQRLTRVRQDLAKLNVAVRLEMEQDTCQQARIAMGCVGPTTMRLKGVEKMLEGNIITEELLHQVGTAVKAEIAPIDDQRSTAEYRMEVSGVILRRVLERAVSAKQAQAGNQ